MNERTYALTSNFLLRHLFTFKLFQHIHSDRPTIFLSIVLTTVTFPLFCTLNPECTPKIPSILNSSQPSTLALLIARQAIVEVREGVEVVYGVFWWDVMWYGGVWCVVVWCTMLCLPSYTTLAPIL